MEIGPNNATALLQSLTESGTETLVDMNDEASSLSSVHVHCGLGMRANLNVNHLHLVLKRWLPREVSAGKTTLGSSLSRRN